MSLKPIAPDSKVKLKDSGATDDSELRGSEADAALEPLLKQLTELQAALYAEAKRSVLVVLQGRDAAGKDGLTRSVFGPLNVQGCVVTNFKRPTDIELSHDYLWRVHQAIPPRGTIGIFNRSHYEDVLVVRVHELVPKEQWKRRFAQINDFERMLTENGVTVLKFFLHISPEEQKERLLERVRDPLKNWKFQAGDLEERGRWEDYTKAYEEVLERCSTAVAPWYIVPGNRKSTRNLLVAQVLVETLDRMKPQFPRVDPKVLKAAKQWEKESA